MPTYWEAFLNEAHKKGRNLHAFEMVDVLEIFWRWLASGGQVVGIKVGEYPNPLDETFSRWAQPVLQRPPG